MSEMSKKAFLLYLVLLIVATAGNCLAGPAADIDAGKRLYDEYCASCHGEKGVGQDPKRRAGGWDANKVRIAPALNGTAHTWHHSPGFLFKYIKKGSIVKDSTMPSFGKELNKQEILSTISYFQSLWPERIRKNYFKKYK
jgi:mono/diheme cytochrome c family protein